jgi:hypothetical protein
MRNVSDKSCIENQKKYFMFNKFLFSENRAVYEIMWKRIVKSEKLQMTIWRIRIAGWIPETKITHSEYVILTALPLQQWLRRRTSMLGFTYFAVNLWCDAAPFPRRRKKLIVPCFSRSHPLFKWICLFAIQILFTRRILFAHMQQFILINGHLTIAS